MLLGTVLLSAAVFVRVEAAILGPSQSGFSSFNVCAEKPTLECGYVMCVHTGSIVARRKCSFILRSVPKDYRNLSAGTANISVARRPATTTPKIGTVFFNFGKPHQSYITTMRILNISSGGPGVPGAALFVSTFADYVADRIGPQWDIVSFDPRGIGASTYAFKSKIQTSASLLTPLPTTDPRCTVSLRKKCNSTSTRTQSSNRATRFRT